MALFLVMGPFSKFTVNDFHEHKVHREKLSLLTAYDFSMAKILDAAGIDAILVGDSLGMVMYGQTSTLKVTVEDMIRHTQAVVEGVSHAMVISDMPFLSFATPEIALKNAGRLIQEGGADAVKIEGGRERVESIRLILDSGIPVMGHIGLTPQYKNRFGGYKLQGKTATAAERLIEDALLLQDAGVFALVLEMVPRQVAEEISAVLEIPTIGIGAGEGCDGQILVGQDMLGFSNNKPFKFVKKYADIWSVVMNAVQAYIQETKSAKFPEDEHSFEMSAEEYGFLKERLSNNTYIEKIIQKHTKSEEKIDLLSKIYGQ